MDLINLQRLSSICIASIIWERQDIKRQIRELFELKPNNELQILKLLREGLKSQLTSPQKDKRYKNFQKIIQTVQQHLNSIQLPTKPKNYVKLIATELGEKIYDWNEYVNDILNFNLKFTEKIFWSPHGTIDEIKIFKAWKNECKLANHKNPDFITPAIYVIACINAQEDFIKKNQNKMEKILQERITDFDLNNYHDKVYTLMSLTLSCHVNRACRENIIINGEDLIIPPGEMFEMCVSACFPNAVYYYWKILQGDIYHSTLVKSLESCLEMSVIYWPNYKLTKLGEILIFLIGKLSNDLKENFLENNSFKILRSVLPAWPFNEQIIPLIYPNLRNLLIEYYREIVFCILFYVKKNSGGSKIIYFRSVFQNIFKDLPVDTKNQIFDLEFLESTHRDTFCLENLILIFKHINFDLRIEALKQIENYIFNWAKEGKIEELNEFIEKILISDEERNNFLSVMSSFVGENHLFNLK